MSRLEKAYAVGTGLQDILPPPIQAGAAPASTDIKFPLGQVWLDTVNGLSYILAKKASGSATWNAMAPGASDVDTLSGDSGGARPPTAGDMIIAGGTNITSAGAASTITINMDAAITLATSVTSPIYTSDSALAINMPAGAFDLTVKLADAAGAQKLSFTDSADAEIADLDSDGTLTVVNMDGIIGATTPAAITGTTIVGNTSLTSGGNVVMSAVATQLVMNGGAVTDFIGQSTLVAGTVTVLNTNIKSTDRVFVSRSDITTSTALGVFDVSITASTSFVIDSRNPVDATVQTADVSIVDWFIVSQT